MSGLLWKEILIWKAGWKTYAFLMALYAVLAVMGNPTSFSFFLAVVLMICPVSSFASDELARWDGFAAVLPGGRRAVVRAKYQFLLVIYGCVFLVSCVINGVIALAQRGDSIGFLPLVVSAAACCGACLLINCVFYPLLFKYGSQKSRLMLAVVFGLLFAVLALGYLVLGQAGLSLIAGKLTGLTPVWLILGIVVFLCAAFAASYGVSCRIYGKKEF